MSERIADDAPPDYEEAMNEEMSLWERFDKMNMTHATEVQSLPKLSGPTTIFVLLDKSSSMDHADIPGVHENQSRAKVAADLLSKIASNPAALQRALHRYGVENPSEFVKNLNMAVIGFGSRSMRIMSARIVRRCPDCAVYEFDHALATTIKLEASPFPAHHFNIGNVMEGQKGEVSVKTCSKCDIPVAEFVCNHHPAWELPETVTPEYVGSESLVRTIHERAMKPNDGLGHHTNVAAGMAVLGAVLTEDGGSVRYQKGVGSEVNGQDAKTEDLVPSSKNSNEIFSRPLRSVALYIGDDEPNVSSTTPYSIMAAHTSFGAKTLIPLVTVQCTGKERWADAHRMRDFAFMNDVVFHNGMDPDGVLDKVCDLLVKAILCTTPHTVTNLNPTHKMVVTRKHASNFIVLPGETLTLMENPLTDSAQDKIEMVEMEPDEVQKIASNVLLLQKIARGDQRVTYVKRKRQ